MKIDTETSHITRLHSGKGLYYGITNSDENIFVASRNRMVSSSVPIEKEEGEILIFDFDFNLIDSIKPPFSLRDMHEIAWHDGRLWVTCSYDNLIAIWDGAVWDKWFPLPQDQDGPHDMHHYNSFLFEEKKIWLLAHNQGDSELFCFACQDRKIIKHVKMGSHAHNIWKKGEELFTCSSGEGKIISDAGFELQIGSFPRGYQHVEGARYVGINEYAERKDRDWTESHILIFDDDWRELGRLDLPDEGMILDIRGCYFR